MKKKFIYSISIFLISLLLLVSSCSSPSNWQTVAIDGYGTIKVPEDWKVSIIDDYIFFSTEINGEEKYALIQYDKSELETSNKYFSGIKEFVFLYDENFSNSTGVTRNKVIYNDGSSKEMYEMYLTSSNTWNSTVFICVDDSVSEDTLRTIAKSYKTGK